MRPDLIEDCMFKIHAKEIAAHSLEQELEKALNQGELELFFQPKYSIGSKSVNGCEALIRWNHTERGLLSPIHFIPLAEKTALINKIGEWTVYVACRQAAAWRIKFGRDISIAVNLSATQFHTDRIVGVVKNALAQHGLPGNCLEIEITENSMIQNPAEAAELIAKIKDLGVSIAIDDFGTGYSGLSLIHNFDVDTIKIDQAFVASIERNPKDQAIIGAVVSMSNDLGYSVVAEGVETQEQYAQLAKIGVHAIQGYLFAKPMPVAGASAFIEAFANRSREPLGCCDIHKSLIAA